MNLVLAVGAIYEREFQACLKTGRDTDSRRCASRRRCAYRNRVSRTHFHAINVIIGRASSRKRRTWRQQSQSSKAVENDRRSGDLSSSFKLHNLISHVVVAYEITRRKTNPKSETYFIA